MEAPVSGRRILSGAFRYSIPVLLGYLAIGTAFGLLLADAGYPWWLALAMSVFMYAGAGQYIAVGLFAAGTSLWEAALVQLVVNARHIAYGFSMLKRYSGAGPFRYYLVFGMTDETFALLSSLPEGESGLDRGKFMCCVTALNQCYWVAGSVIGALAGSLLPFSTSGIGFALTALFVVLLIEQILRVKKPLVFIVSAIPAVLCVWFLPSRMSLLAAMGIALAASSLAEKAGKKPESSQC
jgi:4-azaleucine resistance transporter AzlC